MKKKKKFSVFSRIRPPRQHEARCRGIVGRNHRMRITAAGNLGYLQRVGLAQASVETFEC